MFKLPNLKSEFSKNTFTLIFGTVAAQTIPILLQPILRRMFSPEDFGALAVYLTLFSTITIAFSLRYEAAIVLPGNKNVAANILALTFIINLLFSVTLFVVLFLFAPEITRLLNIPLKYCNYLFFLPLTCLSFSIYQSMNYWLIRQKAFKASANNKIVRRSAEAIAQMGTGFFKITGGLFLGDLIGNTINALVGARQLFKNGFEIEFVSIKKIGYALKRYSDFPKYNLIPTFLSSTASVLPFLIINKIYSTETLGFLDLARTALSIPLAFIAVTISQVFFQQTTEKKNKSESIKKDMRDILLLLSGIVVLEMAVIFTAGPQLFGFIFGKAYTLSGLFSQTLVFGFALNFITSAFSSIFITFEKIRLNSIWQVAYFGAMCSLLLFKPLDINDFLKAYVLIDVIMHSIAFAMMYSIVAAYEKSIPQKIFY
jgi:O-antigen/teichoic acid export membrane protein